MITKQLSEFKKFILRGNVVDLAVGVAIGAAFNNVVTALVRDFITPLIGTVPGIAINPLASFTVGTLVLLAWWLLTRPVFVPAALAKVPWWAWTGGVIGAVFVASATVLVPRLGAASLICLVVAGQLVGSVVLDHFGVLHARQPVDALRVVGLLMVVAGALLVVKPWQSAGA